MVPGEEKAWEILAKSDSADVCARAQVHFDDASGLYRVRSFAREVCLSPRDRTMTSGSPGGDILVQRLAYFYRLSVLMYLNSARDIPVTGRLVSPTNLTGGDTFFRGSHVLPLNKIAERFGNDVEGFMRKAGEAGGEKVGFGDASFTLYPFPRVPVTVLLWVADEEFPARADLLFDSSSELQLPIDILWSIAMMSLLILF